MIKKELKKVYMKLLFPFIILLALAYLCQFFEIFQREESEFSRIFSVTLLVLAALFSLALPVFYRTLFVNKIKDRKTITINEFLKFEKDLIVIAMIAPYFVFFTLLISIPEFYSGTVIIIALYAIYYYYPSEKRIKFEKRLFRITEENK